MKQLKCKHPTLRRRVETRYELFADRADADPIHTSTVVTEGRYDLIKLGAVAAVLFGSAAIALVVKGEKERKAIK